MNKVSVKIGDRFFNKICGWYHVVDIVSTQRVKVMFDETNSIVECSKYHCHNGMVSDRKNKYYHQVGEVYENMYGKYQIIEILPYKKAIIQFFETGTIIKDTIRNIVKGNVKDHFKPIIFGVGYIGIRRNYGKISSKNKAYKTWYNMLRRCYDNKSFKKHPTYSDCYVCEEWKCFANFEKWFDENYIEGYCLDKDILFKLNKIYSPQTCCFVPNEINCLFTKRQNKRGDLPIGVCYSESKRRYKVSFTRGAKRFYIGYYSTQEEAFQAYKEAKESWIKEVANKWKDKLAPNVYEALMNYEVEITD